MLDLNTDEYKKWYNKRTRIQTDQFAYKRSQVVISSDPQHDMIVVKQIKNDKVDRKIQRFITMQRNPKSTLSIILKTVVIKS
jgi:hypothetical protein